MIRGVDFWFSPYINPISAGGNFSPPVKYCKYSENDLPAEPRNSEFSSYLVIPFRRDGHEIFEMKTLTSAKSDVITLWNRSEWLILICSIANAFYRRVNKFSTINTSPGIQNHRFLLRSAKNLMMSAKIRSYKVMKWVSIINILMQLSYCFLVRSQQVFYDKQLFSYSKS